MAKLRSTKSVAVGASINPLTLARLGVLARDNNRTISAEISNLLDATLKVSTTVERILVAAREQDATDTQRGKTDPRTPARQVLANLAGQITAAPAVPAANVKLQPEPASGPHLVQPSAPIPAVEVEPSKERIQEVEALIRKANELLNSGASVEVVVEETNLLVEDVEGLIELRKVASQKRAEQRKSKPVPIQSAEPPRLSEPEKVLEELLPPDQRGPRVEPAYAQPEFTLDEMVPTDTPLTPSAPSPEEKVASEVTPPASDPAPIIDDAPADPLPPGASVPRGLLIRGDDE